MRIVFIGPQGTGKSSLAICLAMQLEYPLIEEIARDEAIRLKIPTDSQCLNMDIRYIWQIAILSHQLKREEEDSRRYGRFVSDRSVLDNFAYLSILADMKDSPVPKDYWSFWKERLHPSIKSYTHIFYPEPLPTIKDDGFRNTDPQYQKKVIKKIEEIIIDFRIENRILRVPLLPIEERVNWVRKHF